MVDPGWQTQGQRSYTWMLGGLAKCSNYGGGCGAWCRGDMRILRGLTKSSAHPSRAVDLCQDLSKCHGQVLEGESRAGLQALQGCSGHYSENSVQTHRAYELAELVVALGVLQLILLLPGGEREPDEIEEMVYPSRRS